MTIHEIAKLANVSVSTVSKIMNKKDKSISEETRNRVLGIVKEYNYTPYGDRLSEQSTLFGVMLIPEMSRDFLTAVIECAKEGGYSVIVCTSATAEEELENAKTLSQHHVRGVIWCKDAFSTEQPKAFLKEQGIPVFVVDVFAGATFDSASINYLDLGASAAERLVGFGHRKIGCVRSMGWIDLDSLIGGINIEMAKCGSACTQSDLHLLGKSQENLPAWLQEYTAVICTDENAAREVLAAAESMGIHVPNDLSIIMLSKERKGKTLDVSAMVLPYYELGRFTVERLTSQVEHRRTGRASFNYAYTVDGPASLARPRVGDKKKIVVIGTINYDTLIMVEKPPELGETIGIQGIVVIPGGKGLNQAVAASKLGIESHLLAKLGRDYEGRAISAFLKSGSVIIDGVSAEDGVPTGRAYIYIQRDGESSISVNDGANGRLSVEDIERNRELFRGASFCLLQTEIAPGLVERAADIAHEYGVKTILKPCAVNSLRKELLSKIDILIPNQKEARRLLPGISSIEEQADAFAGLGVETVIITLGAQGCYLRSEGCGRYFPPADFDVVDTTGAADAFIATLAAYLANGRGMEAAVEYATTAAGISTTRFGLSSAVTDQSTLELCHSKRYPSRNEGVLQ